MTDFEGKTAIVTGAAGALGRVVARAFHDAGARVVLADREKARVEAAHEELAGSDRVLTVGVELTHEASAARLASVARDAFDSIDVLVNVAGGFAMGKVHELSVDDWDRMHDANARTAFLASRAVLPVMLRQGRGAIVNVGARAALGAGAGLAAYAASKAAVVRLTEAMAADYGEAGVTVNCVLPGTIDTPANREAMPKARHDRWVRPEAIADVILFLASERARAVRGAAVPVYGGS